PSLAIYEHFRPHSSSVSFSRFAQHFPKTIRAYKRTENSTASPRGKQYLKSNFAAFIQNTHPST
ncbi:MAG: hypothetical protein IKK17_00290, partial [Oscillospiraceae bacterium]|nr:hypothetical protein [Oscillospiraceae bacterium]